MKLLKLTVRNYRTHKEKTIEFDSRQTLIGGQNESGKSTLVEAAHRVLFLQANGKTQEHRDMKSNLWSGDPEVELTFNLGGQEYHLKKSFSGKGGTFLQEQGQKTLRDQEAEARLMELLNAEQVRGRQLRGQWSHLWAWQGTVDRDVTGMASHQSADLFSLLQDEGAAVVTMSDMDKSISDYFETYVSENLKVSKTAGAGIKPRAQTAWANAESDSEVLTEEYEKAQSKLSDLELSIQDFNHATANLKTLRSSQDKIRTIGGELQVRKEKIQDLKAKEHQALSDFESKEKELKSLQKEDQAIQEKRRELKVLEESLEPAQKKLSGFQMEVSLARKDLDGISTAKEALGKQVKATQKLKELAMLFKRSFDEDAQYRALKKKAGTAEKLKEKIKENQSKLSTMPPVDEDAVDQLKNQQNEIDKLAASLDAIAARVELLWDGDDQTSLGSTKLKIGQSQIITKETTISWADQPFLKITPGGGEDIGKMEKALVQSREQFADCLQQLGVANMDEVVQLNLQRQSLLKEVENLHAELRGLGGDEISRDLEESKNVINSTSAEIERLLKAGIELGQPADLEAALETVRQLDQQYSVLEGQEVEHETRMHTSREHLNNLADDLDALATQVKDYERSIDVHKSVLKSDLQRVGEDDIRSQQMTDLLGEVRQYEARLQKVKQTLEELDPEQFEADLKRNERAKEENASQIEVTLRKLAAAESHLKSEGTMDPKEEAEIAQSRLLQAEERATVLQREAHGHQLLHELFSEEKKRISDEYAKPLSEKIEGYLSKLFGGVTVHLDMDGNEFNEFIVTRPGKDGDTYPLENLSKGTREQVSVAIRLAIAEVLAGKFDGSLPVILDDAFVNSDDERIEKLQSMLDYATRQGLQLILFSCTPDDYATLGAKTIML